MSKIVLKLHYKLKSLKTRFYGDYQLRSAHAAKHVRVEVITNFGQLHTLAHGTDIERSGEAPAKTKMCNRIHQNGEMQISN